MGAPSEQAAFPSIPPIRDFDTSDPSLSQSFGVRDCLALRSSSCGNAGLRVSRSMRYNSRFSRLRGIHCRDQMQPNKLNQGPSHVRPSKKKYLSSVSNFRSGNAYCLTRIVQGPKYSTARCNQPVGGQPSSLCGRDHIRGIDPDRSF